MITLDAETLGRIRESYLAESQDLLERMLEAMLVLDEGGGAAPAARGELRSALHTFKGASAAAQFPEFALLAHALEEVCEPEELDADRRRFLFDGLDYVTAALPQRCGLGGAEPPPLVEFLAGCPVELPGHVLERAAALLEEAPVSSGEAPAEGADESVGGAAPAPRAAVPSEGPDPDVTDAGRRAVFGDADASTFRVRSSDIEDLLEELGELLITAGGLEPVTAELRAEEATRKVGVQATRILERIQRQIGLCQESARRLRMVPANVLNNPLRLLLRDSLEVTGKEATLDLRGGDIRLDRRIIEELRGMLVHLLRNAVDHGLEAPERREAKGKPRAGRVGVRFALSAASVEVEVSDDGAGVDPDEVGRMAVRRGVLTDDELANLDPEARLDLVFRPGFSTREEVSATSGRGVGLCAVRERAQLLGGQISLASEPGRGTRFRVQVPLTTTTVAALMIRAGRQLLALPMEGIERVVTGAEAEEETLLGTPSVLVEGERVGVRDLAGVLDVPVPPDARPGPLVVVRGTRTRLALRVSEIFEQRDVVFRPLGPRFRRFRVLSGATLLGTGEVVPILDLEGILGMVSSRRQAASLGEVSEDAEAPLVLLVDDSVTLLGMTSSILERAGYRVLMARSGDEALTKLAEGPDVSLVLTDVDMPRMDGFTLTRHVKQDPATASLPVIVLTSNDDEQSRRKGMDAGADAYLVKGRVDAESLRQAVGRFVPV